MVNIGYTTVCIAYLLCRTVTAGDAQPFSVATRPTRPAPWQWNHAIYCEGPLPSMWEHVQYINSRGIYTAGFRTIRELCARPTYGGNTAFNMGAWWYDMFNMISFGRDFMSQMTQNSCPIPRMAEIFCSLRCKPVPLQEEPLEGLDLHGRTNRMAAHLEDSPRTYTVFNKEVFRPEDRKINILVSRESHPPRDLRGISHQYAFSIDEVGVIREMYSDNLRCRGNLPPRDTWPPPFNNPDPNEENEHSPNRPFKDITALCASLWFGGDPRGNAGIGCRYTKEGKTVRVLESFIAHPALYRRNPLGGFFIDIWCMRACDCPSTEEEKAQPLRTIIPVRELTGAHVDDELAFQDSGNIVVLLKTGTGNPELHNLPNYGSIQKESPVQQEDGLPPEVLKSFMQELPDPLFFSDISENKPQSPQQCGISCTGPSDCIQTRECRSCVARPTKRLLQASGLGPFIPFAAGAVCLSLSRDTSAIQLGGRNLKSDWQNLVKKRAGQPDLRDVACHCNATYISSACCDAPLDGIIYEDANVRLNLPSFV